jgi:hypothetical protein
MDEKDIKIQLLEDEIVSLKEQLKKYTNPDRNKKYQEKNKEKILEYAKEYQKKYYQEKKLKKLNDENN